MTIQMVPYEALYRRKCQSLLHWKKIGENDTLAKSLGLKMTKKIIKDLRLIRERIKQA